MALDGADAQRGGAPSASVRDDGLRTLAAGARGRTEHGAGDQGAGQPASLGRAAHIEFAEATLSAGTSTSPSPVPSGWLTACDARDALAADALWRVAEAAVARPRGRADLLPTRTACAADSQPLPAPYFKPDF